MLGVGVRDTVVLGVGVRDAVVLGVGVRDAAVTDAGVRVADPDAAVSDEAADTDFLLAGGGGIRSPFGGVLRGRPLPLLAGGGVISTSKNKQINTSLQLSFS